MISKKENIIGTFLTEKDFTDFFHNWYSSFCFFAHRFVKDHCAAEDIVIEIAGSIWRKRDTIKHAEALKNYFYISIRHACIRFLENKKRRASREKELNEDYIFQERTILENIIHTEMLQQLEEALNHLPTQCRKVFTKLYIEGKTVSEAARELHLSLNTIKTHRKRGLQLLRNNITSLLLIAVWLSK